MRHVPNGVNRRLRGNINRLNRLDQHVLGCSCIEETQIMEGAAMTVSVWQDSAAWPGEAEHQELEADVCIIGGGVVGALLSRLLVEAGQRVIVLEARTMASGASGRNAGHCIVGGRDRYHEMIERLGHDPACQLREAFVAGREWIAELCDQYQVPFERSGSRYLAIDEREAERLRRSYEALAAGGHDVSWADEDPWGKGFSGMIVQHGDLGLQPYLLVSRVMADSGATVIENCEVRAIEQQGERVIVRGRRATVSCQHAILATNAYSRLLHPYFADKVFPTRAQAYATEPADVRIFDGPTGTNDGFEYFRQLPDRRVIIGGYRDVYAAEEVGYADETTPHLQAGLQQWLAARFPELGELQVTHRWSGAMGFTSDGYPLIGQLPDLPAVYFCVGFNGGGMSMGPVAARWTVKYLLEGEHPHQFHADRLMTSVNVEAPQH